MPTLQVKVEEGLLVVLRRKAKAIGLTQAEYVTRWLEGLAGGGEGPEEAAEIPAASGGGSEVPAAGTASRAMVPTPPADGGLLEELQRQTALLEQLVGANTGKGVIPAAVAEAVIAEPAPAAEVVITPPAGDQGEQAAEQPAEQEVVPAQALEEESVAVDLLAAQRARRLAELESWSERYGAEVAAANRAEAAAAMEAAMPSGPSPAVKKRKASSAEFLEKLKAAAAAAEVEAGPGMGGSEVGDLTGVVTGDAAPERAEGSGTTAIEVLAPADEGPILADASAGDDDLLKRVEELAEQERLLENWVGDLRAGGDPVAPPLPEGASEQDWQAAAEECLRARGKEPTEELVGKVLQHWGRG